METVRCSIWFVVVSFFLALSFNLVGVVGGRLWPIIIDHIELRENCKLS